MNIPLVDLRIQYQSIRSEIDQAVSKTLERGDFILGEDVSGFERNFLHFVAANTA